MSAQLARTAFSHGCYNARAEMGFPESLVAWERLCPRTLWFLLTLSLHVVLIMALIAGFRIIVTEPSLPPIVNHFVLSPNVERPASRATAPAMIQVHETKASKPPIARLNPDAAFTQLSITPELIRPEASVPSAAFTDDNGYVTPDIEAFRKALQNHIAQFRRYPPQALRTATQGTATVAFHLARDGDVDTVHLVGTSGSSVLDREAVATVRRASPLPAVPSTLPDELTVSVPVTFAFRENGERLASLVSP